VYHRTRRSNRVEIILVPASRRVLHSLIG